MPSSRFSFRTVATTLLLVAFGVVGLPLLRSIAANETLDAKTQATESSDSCELTALFHVSSEQPQLFADTQFIRNWQIFSHTQLAYLKSYFVLQSALRTAGIQNLPLLQSHSDPVGWLKSELEVGFQQDSEILYVRMHGNAADQEDLRKIVDAVCDAYLKEVVFEEEQRRLVVRDALQRSYSSLSEEIRNKLDAQNALAEELGFADQDGRSRVLQDLDLKRLDRIETELLRLENEQLSAQVYSDQEKGSILPKERAQLTFYGKRIEELRKRQAELETRIVKRNQSSVELTIGANELEQLQEIAREMSLKLEQMDVEAVAPDRIRMIQRATSS